MAASCTKLGEYQHENRVAPLIQVNRRWNQCFHSGGGSGDQLRLSAKSSAMALAAI
jgi:hypothetical protein